MRIVPVATGIAAAARRASGRRPVGGSGESSPLLVYSLLIATFLGTMGLPHILVRFYTNPDGHAARHTTVRVLGLLSLFYLFPARLRRARAGADAAAVHDRADRRRRADAAAGIAWPGTVGTMLTALTCAGAFAAFLSTSSGLLVSLAGHDQPRRLAAAAPRAPSRVAIRRRLHFRIAAAAGRW